MSSREPKLLEAAAARGAALRIEAMGQVQGVGFRPFVVRLATACGLTGEVRNTAAGAAIDAEGRRADLERFVRRLRTEAPMGACIEELRIEPCRWANRQGFAIAPPSAAGPLAARAPTDRAPCAACLRDLQNPGNRRFSYAFTTCVDCGPRHSLLDALPYDRERTAMREFPLCPACAAEFADPADRRFRAETIACPTCGPQIAYRDAAGGACVAGAAALRSAADLLAAGKILALKGLGGFQLLLRADDAAAVAELRQRKQRPTKPLAVMLPPQAVEPLRSLLPPAAFAALTAPANPILLLPKRLLHQLPAGPPWHPSLWAEAIAPGAADWGILLPSSPLHHLLLASSGGALVCTSGNGAEEPLALTDDEADAALSGIADGFLTHDRPIRRRLDDSVQRWLAEGPCPIRLARGFAPVPAPALERLAKRRGAPPMLAVGGQQKSAVAVWTGAQALLAPHGGDLGHPRTHAGFTQAIDDLKQLYRFEPERLACDAHPDYASTRWARRQPLPCMEVQHHHAHALAALAEHALLEEKAAALCWDGAGLGADGTLWGGEALLVKGAAFRRLASLRPFPLPGGEAASREPWRSAFGLLWVALGADSLLPGSPWLSRLGISTSQALLLARMIERGVNVVWTSSMGRLFDGVAALVLGCRTTTYEGEAAARLEAAAEGVAEEPYPLPLVPAASLEGSRAAGASPDWQFDLGPLVRALLADIEAGEKANRLAARFHASLAEAAAAGASLAPGLPVLLTGGCFQNRLLVETALARLREAGREPLVHRLVPPNDGGLALGQLAAALLRWPADSTEGSACA